MIAFKLPGVTRLWVRGASTVAVITGPSSLGPWAAGAALRGALCLILTGGALWALAGAAGTHTRTLSRSRIWAGRFLAGLIVVLGGSLVRGNPCGSMFAPGPAGSGCHCLPEPLILVLLGLGLIAGSMTGWQRAAFWCGVAALMITAAPVVGGFCHGFPLCLTSCEKGIVWPSVIAFGALSIALILSTGAKTSWSLINPQPDPGGALLRRLLPAALLLPMLVRGMERGAEVTGLADVDTARGLGVILLTVCLVVMLWKSAFRISEHSRSLRESEERLRLQRQRMPIGCLVFDAENRFSQLNPAAEAIFGYAESELLGGHANLIVPEPAREHVDEVMRRLAEGDMKAHSINENVRKDGQLITCEWTNTPLRDPAGHYLGILSMVQDVTARRESEEALRLTRERLETALIASQVVVFQQDLDLRYTWIHNPALGYSAHQVVGRRDVDVFERTEDAARTEAIKREVIATGRAQRQEVEVTHGGEPFFYDLVVQPRRDAAGRTIGVVCAAVDITSRKRVEQRLAASLRELREAQQGLMRQERLATLGNLAGSVAHEMRTPLCVVRNSTVFLQHVLGSANGDISEALAEMDRAVSSCDHIITEMLDYVRDPRAGGEKTTVFQIQEVISVALRGCSVPASVQLRRLELATEPLHVRANADQVIRILINLLQNALQSMPEGGLIETGAELAEGNMVRLTVRDTGCGIPAEQLERIFEPLFSTKIKGIGLGLAIAQRYARLNGGELSVESVAGEGTTFRLLLPGGSEIA